MIPLARNASSLSFGYSSQLSFVTRAHNGPYRSKISSNEFMMYRSTSSMVRPGRRRIEPSCHTCGVGIATPSLIGMGYMSSAERISTIPDVTVPSKKSILTYLLISLISKVIGPLNRGNDQSVLARQGQKSIKRSSCDHQRGM